VMHMMYMKRKYKTILIRSIATFIVCAFSLNCTSYGLEIQHAPKKACLAPTSYFKPIVRIKHDSRSGKYTIEENNEIYDRDISDGGFDWERETSKKDYVLLCVSLLIPQAMKENLSVDWMRDNIDAFIKSKCDSEDFEHLDKHDYGVLKNVFKWDEIARDEDSAVYMPYHGQMGKQKIKYYLNPDGKVTSSLHRMFAPDQDKNVLPPIDNVPIPIEGANAVMVDPLVNDEKAPYELEFPSMEIGTLRARLGHKKVHYRANKANGKPPVFLMLGAPDRSRVKMSVTRNLGRAIGLPVLRTSRLIQAAKAEERPEFRGQAYSPDFVYGTLLKEEIYSGDPSDSHISKYSNGFILDDLPHDENFFSTLSQVLMNSGYEIAIVIDMGVGQPPYPGNGTVSHYLENIEPFMRGLRDNKREVVYVSPTIPSEVVVTTLLARLRRRQKIMITVQSEDGADRARISNKFAAERPLRIKAYLDVIAQAGKFIEKYDEPLKRRGIHYLNSPLGYSGEIHRRLEKTRVRSQVFILHESLPGQYDTAHFFVKTEDDFIIDACPIDGDLPIVIHEEEDIIRGNYLNAEPLDDTRQRLAAELVRLCELACDLERQANAAVRLAWPEAVRGRDGPDHVWGDQYYEFPSDDETRDFAKLNPDPEYADMSALQICDSCDYLKDVVGEVTKLFADFNDVEGFKINRSVKEMFTDPEIQPYVKKRLHDIIIDTCLDRFYQEKGADRKIHVYTKGRVYSERDEAEEIKRFFREVIEFEPAANKLEDLIDKTKEEVGTINILNVGARMPFLEAHASRSYGIHVCKRDKNHDIGGAIVHELMALCGFSSDRFNEDVEQAYLAWKENRLDKDDLETIKATITAETKREEEKEINKNFYDGLELYDILILKQQGVYVPDNLIVVGCISPEGYENERELEKEIAELMSQIGRLKSDDPERDRLRNVLRMKIPRLVATCRSPSSKADGDISSTAEGFIASILEHWSLYRITADDIFVQFQLQNIKPGTSSSSFEKAYYSQWTAGKRRGQVFGQGRINMTRAERLLKKAVVFANRAIYLRDEYGWENIYGMYQEIVGGFSCDVKNVVVNNAFRQAYETFQLFLEVHTQGVLPDDKQDVDQDITSVRDMLERIIEITDTSTEFLNVYDTNQPAAAYGDNAYGVLGTLRVLYKALYDEDIYPAIGASIDNELDKTCKEYLNSVGSAAGEETWETTRNFVMQLLYLSVPSRDFLSSIASPGNGGMDSRGDPARDVTDENIVPVVTPLVGRGHKLQVDKKGIKGLVDHLVFMGVRSILVMGAAGEFTTLTNEMRIKAIDAFQQAAGDRLVVFANVTGDNRGQTLMNVEKINKMPHVNAIVLAPRYYIPEQKEIVEHLNQVVKKTALPFVIYNNPHIHPYGDNILSGIVDRIKRAFPVQFIAMKDSSGNIGIVKAYARRITTFQGDETKISMALEAGAGGAVSSMGNVLEEPTLIFDPAFRTEREDLQDEIKRRVKALTANRKKTPAAIKHYLKLAGVIKDDAVYTEEQSETEAVTLTDDERQAIEDVYEDKERKIINDFINMVKYRAVQAREAGEELIVGIGTNWIPEYGKNGCQRRGLNPIITELRNAGLNNVNIIDDDEDSLEERIIAAAGGRSNYDHVVVLADKNYVEERTNFGELKKKNAFIAGVSMKNMQGLKYKPQIRLLNMITVALALSFIDEDILTRQLLIIKQCSRHLGLQILNRRRITFEPDAEPVNPELYKLQLKLLRNA